MKKNKFEILIFVTMVAVNYEQGKETKKTFHPKKRNTLSEMN